MFMYRASPAGWDFSPVGQGLEIGRTVTVHEQIQTLNYTFNIQLQHNKNTTNHTNNKNSHQKTPIQVGALAHACWCVHTCFGCLQISWSINHHRDYLYPGRLLAPTSTEASERLGTIAPTHNLSNGLAKSQEPVPS